MNYEQAVLAVAPYSIRIEDPEYLAWVRQFPCAICEKPGPSDPHHLRSGGMSLKCHDYETIPMCRECHNRLHSTGKKTFMKENLPRVIESQLLCLTSYIYSKKESINS